MRTPRHGEHEDHGPEEDGGKREELSGLSRRRPGTGAIVLLLLLLLLKPLLLIVDLQREFFTGAEKRPERPQGGLAAGQLFTGELNGSCLPDFAGFLPDHHARVREVPRCRVDPRLRVSDLSFQVGKGPLESLDSFPGRDGTIE